MDNNELIKNLRTVPDFPYKGIMFYDVTTLFKNPAAMEIGRASCRERV